MELKRRLETLMDNDDNPQQVRLTISTDYGYTAEFLRQLANEIESREDEPEEYESYRGSASIEWPG